MAAPTTNTDANGRLVSIGNGVQLSGVVQSVSNGVATILLTEAYGPETVTVRVSCCDIRQQKLKS
jgi:hypothetical protein